MSGLIATIILIISFFGILVILFRKIPALAELPDILERRSSVALRLRGKIKELNPFKDFSFEIFLQKILSKIRILTLKLENKTANWLQKLREKMKKKKLENDNYWKELKKIKKEK